MSSKTARHRAPSGTSLTGLTSPLWTSIRNTCLESGSATASTLPGSTQVQPAGCTRPEATNDTTPLSISTASSSPAAVGRNNSEPSGPIAMPVARGIRTILREASGILVLISMMAPPRASAPVTAYTSVAPGRDDNAATAPRPETTRLASSGRSDIGPVLQSRPAVSETKIALSESVPMQIGLPQPPSIMTCCVGESNIPITEFRRSTK